MNAEVIRRYRAERATGTPAKPALQIAKHTTRAPAHAFLAELDTDTPVNGAIGPFAVAVKVRLDEDAKLGDDDVSGTFTDVHEPGCVKNTRRDWGTDYEWYRPATYTLHHAYDDNRRRGMSKQVAREAVAAQIKRELVEDAGREYVGVIVTVTVAGRELAREALWWIDCPPDHDNRPYLIEVAEDLIEQAIGAARDAIPAALEANAVEAAALRRALAWNRRWWYRLRRALARSKEDAA